MRTQPPSPTCMIGMLYTHVVTFTLVILALPFIHIIVNRDTGNRRNSCPRAAMWIESNVYYQAFSRLISPNAVGAKYSPIGGQCLQESAAKFKSSVPSVLAVIDPTTLNLFLLILTIVKAFRGNALSKSHPSSPTVCIAPDFGLSMKTILRPPRCCVTNFCMWSSEPLWSRFSYFCITDFLS